MSATNEAGAAAGALALVLGILRLFVPLLGRWIDRRERGGAEALSERLRVAERRVVEVQALALALAVDRRKLLDRLARHEGAREAE